MSIIHIHDHEVAKLRDFPKVISLDSKDYFYKDVVRDYYNDYINKELITAIIYENESETVIIHKGLRHERTRTRYKLDGHSI